MGKKHATSRAMLKAVVSICCLAVTLSAWLLLRAVLPVAGAASLIEARSDQSRHHYSIVLNVRDAGAYGHARLTWIKHRSNDDWSAVAFGYYAERFGSVVEVFDTSGKVEDEAGMAPGPGQETRLALVFWIDQEQYDATLARVGRWQRTGRYRLFERDCVTFVADILKPLDLKMPSRLLLPTPRQYVLAISELNAQRPRE